jgi:uncharacterized protein (DUF885 family)
MPDTGSSHDGPAARTVRDLADSYVESLADLDPVLATRLGLPSAQDRLPDLSPDGQQALDELARSTLSALGALDGTAARPDGHERRCARLLRERLETALAISETGEHLRAVRNILGPVQDVRIAFTLMPTATEEDWAVVARRMAQVPPALAGHIASLREGAGCGLLAAPRQVEVMVAQLGEWVTAGGSDGWFAGFAANAQVPAALRAELDAAAAAATAAAADLAGWLAREYLPRAEGTPDAVGEQRYRVLSRQWTGADVELAEAYEWGWSEFLRLRAEMREQAQRVLPGASVAEAMSHLDAHGAVTEGAEQIRRWLQQMIDQTIAILDGAHFVLADQLKVVESRIAPDGSAAAPYYTAPSQDFSRPGRTWLPILGRTRFPHWKLISTWYHEGVPGHHLQLAQWVLLSGELSTYQATVGSVSAAMEGWALYAERLMDELGFLADPGARLGYLDAQMMRAIRVVIDIGMHLRRTVPAGSPLGAGEQWTPELARQFFGAHTGEDAGFVESEIVRYLGVPGQAISYKLGERAWLAGREAARAARGTGFDLKSWHMAALGLGSLGLDDLGAELALL